METGERGTGNVSPDFALFPKELNISDSHQSEGTSYLLCFYADAGFWRVAVRPHHYDSHLEPGLSSSQSEPNLLPRVGCFTAPLQRRLKASKGPIKLRWMRSNGEKKHSTWLGWSVGTCTVSLMSSPSERTQ